MALGGFMGTGKSTVGAALARHLGIPFVDLDAVLVASHGPIATQFARDGEAAFRARERDALRTLCDGLPRVLATGGGAWVDPTHRAWLRAHYHTVVLAAPLETLAERLGASAERPLWSRAAALYASRAEAYADADLCVDTATRTVDEVVAHIAAWLEGRCVGGR